MEGRVGTLIINIQFKSRMSMEYIASNLAMYFVHT